MCRLRAGAFQGKASPWDPPYAVYDVSSGDIFLEPEYVPVFGLDLPDPCVRLRQRNASMCGLIPEPLRVAGICMASETACTPLNEACF